MQYGNIQPSIEVEAETFEDAQALVEPHMLALWNKYAPNTIKTDNGNRKLLKAFCGGEVYYDEDQHVYTNEAGDVYLSGSQYANSFRKPFDKEKIAKLMADKIEADPQDIIKMWELRGNASKDFGNAIHRALQLYEQYGDLAERLNKTTHSHDHPVIKHAVDSFIEAHKGEKVISEALVVDNANKKAGQIDRLLITSRKKCRIQDFKTNADITKELDIYWKQLEFYGEIMEAGGWQVEGYDIFHYNGEWTTHNKELKEDK